MPVPIFDEADRGRHPEDYELLHYGHAHLYRNEWARDRLINDLQALGYVCVTVDLTRCVNSNDLRGAFIASVPGWPPDYGLTTWPGFTDGLTDYLLSPEREQVVLDLRGFDQPLAVEGTEVWVLLDLLVSIGRWHLLFGRRLICLVQTDRPDLDPLRLGGEDVRWSRHEFLLVHRAGARIPPWIAKQQSRGGEPA
jgi:hypothetical protein